MLQRTKDELGGAAIGMGLAAVVWLWLVCTGCSPALPNAPNAQPTRHAQPASHDKDPTFQPGVLPCIVALPPPGQHFDTTATVRARLRWTEPSDLGYAWEGSTCARMGNILLGKAAHYYPVGSAGIIAAQVTPDSVTVWGDISTYVSEEFTSYHIEVQVGALVVNLDDNMRPVPRLSPITCRGKLIYCTIVGECAMDPGEQAGGELEEAEYWPAQPRRVMP